MWICWKFFGATFQWLDVLQSRGQHIYWGNFKWSQDLVCTKCNVYFAWLCTVLWKTEILERNEKMEYIHVQQFLLQSINYRLVYLTGTLNNLSTGSHVNWPWIYPSIRSYKGILYLKVKGGSSLKKAKKN